MILVGGYQRATACSGSAQPGTKALMAVCMARFRVTNLGIYACRTVAGSGSKSIHAEGRAADMGTGPTRKPTAVTLFLAEQLRVFSRELGVQGIIHNRRCWFSNTGTAWDPYSGSNPHEDHIHVEQTRTAGKAMTAAVATRVLVGPSVNGDIAGPVLQLGARGAAVYDVQGRLRAHGFAIARDSIYGPATVKAVQRFQGFAGLPIDGKVGPVTRGRLR